MSTTSESDAAAKLQAAHDRLQRLREDIDIDRDDLDAVADAYEAIEEVLDRWQERATDWDDFEGYVEFRNDLSATLASIPEDVPESEAFVEADGHVKTGSATRSLRQRDFDAAREALSPAREYAETRTELREASDCYREACRTAKRRREELTDRIDDLERLVELSDADLDAPTETLQEPIARYNDAVEAAFATFRHETPSREVLSFVVTAADYPLVDYRKPPEELVSYLRAADAGSHPIPELLEYAEYSRSKLSHYVEDADRLKRRVATNRTYLEGLSVEPLTIAWPPTDRETLRFRVDELVSVLGRFADEETMVTLREVRALTHRDDYERLRTAALARAELTDDERKRVESGAVETELETARKEQKQLDEAIETYAGAATR